MGGSELGVTGGLVEIDDSGQVVRSASSADPAFPDALLTPYSLVVLPELDRVVSTNSSMHDDDIFKGATFQVWRLSDLKLLETSYFDVGKNRYAHISPEEPRLAPDGSIFVQTLGCGLERITGVRTDEPRSQLVHTFPGNWCGVPTIVGHFLIQSVPATNGLIVLDITNGAEPRGGVAPQNQRHVQAALDGMGRQDRAARRDGIRAAPLPAQAGRAHGRADDGRRAARRRRQKRCQLREPPMAPRLDRVGHAARRGVFAIARRSAYFPYTSARVW